MNKRCYLSLRGYLWVVITLLAFSSFGISPSRSQESKPELPRDQLEQLLQHQPVLADPAIFTGDSFPRIDFLDKDLLKAALGPYSLTLRYFDTAWHEVQKPTNPGRYGAWAEIHFASGLTDIRHLTLFKSTTPYKPRRDPYRVQVQFPLAFGVSDQAVASEQWNTQEFVNAQLNEADHDNEGSAVLVAAIHDADADPARWHGFNFRRIDEAWWTGLENKLGIFREYQHLVRVPNDYDAKPDEKWPLILFLHGSGERGDDLNKLQDQGPLGYINHGHPLPFVVVTPQCPRREWWSPESLDRLVVQMEAPYRIDPKRIYVTGLSMGGYGTFDLAASFPQRFAAIAPLSGGENPAIAERLKGIPTWIFHGQEDEVVPARYSVDIAEAMKKIGAEVKLTLYPGVGHGGWDKTYADPALYDWFLQHTLN